MTRTALPKLSILSLAGLVFALSCSADGDPSRTATPNPGGSSSSVDVILDCPAQAEALTSGEARVIAGDLDGDSVSDQVALAEPTDGCPSTVVVEVGGAVRGMAIREETAGPGLPRLAGIIDADEDGGAEIVVAVAAGASTEFFGIFTWSVERLERLEVPSGRFGSLFPSGGSAGHLDASDCADERELVISSATPSGDAYRVVRQFYELRSGRLEPADRQRLEVGADRIAAFEEFATTPFGSCPPA